MMRCLLLALLCCALPARAELWVYVDGGGVAHFATRAVDARFQRVLADATDAADAPRVSGKADATAKLLVWLDIAPEVKALSPWLRMKRLASVCFFCMSPGVPEGA